MALICSSGIQRVVREVIGDKGYFSLNKEGNFIKTITKGKLKDPNVAFRATERLAQVLNKGINNGRAIGEVFHTYNRDTLGVQILPTNKQLTYLNAEEGKEQEEALKELEEERQKTEFDSLSKASNTYENQGDIFPTQEDVLKDDEDISEKQEIAYNDEQDDDTEQLNEENNVSLEDQTNTEFDKQLQKMLLSGEVIVKCN